MPELRTTIEPSLDGLVDDDLDEILADGHPFASRTWYRFLDSLDLAPIIGGQVEKGYVVAWSESKPVGLCPFLIPRGPGLYFAYSLHEYYFHHWIADAIRLAPDRQAFFSRLHAGVRGYENLLEWAGCELRSALIVTSPLSYRCHLSATPDANLSRQTLFGTMIDRLQKEARTRRLPLWFLAVPESHDHRLSSAFREAGCEPVFLFHDNQLMIDRFADFESYLASFSRTTRRAFQRDMSRTAAAGIRLSFSNDFVLPADRFSHLYQTTYSRYGESYFRHSPDFFQQLGRTLESNAELILAKRDDEIVGFSILLSSERRGEMFTYRIGRDDAGDLAKVPYYFDLSFYGPIRRAIELGYRRIWLGPAGYEAKSVRGASQIPLFSYFWFPRRVERWFLLPYLRLFGKYSVEEIEKSLPRVNHATSPDQPEPAERIKPTEFAKSSPTKSRELAYNHSRESV